MQWLAPCAYTQIFQLCNIAAFSSMKPAKRQKICTVGRSRYDHVEISIGFSRGTEWQTILSMPRLLKPQPLRRAGDASETGDFAPEAPLNSSEKRDFTEDRSTRCGSCLGSIVSQWAQARWVQEPLWFLFFLQNSMDTLREFLR